MLFAPLLSLPLFASKLLLNLMFSQRQQNYSRGHGRGLEAERVAKELQARQEKLRLQEETYQRKMEAKIQEQKEIIGGLFDDH
jgi:hypothetical protein